MDEGATNEEPLQEVSVGNARSEGGEGGGGGGMTVAGEEIVCNAIPPSAAKNAEQEREGVFGN